MRVTQQMTVETFRLQVQRQAAEILGQQKRIATQKRVLKPSDDPGAMARILDYRSRLQRIDQYDRHIDRAKNRIEFTEPILDQAASLVKQAQEIAERNRGSSVTAEERRSAADEVKQIYDQLLRLANSTYQNNYLFSGHQTDTAPFTRDADYNVTYHGDAGGYRVSMGENMEVSLDADGRNYFHDTTGGVSVFDQLRDLIAGLENPDLDAGTAQIDATLDPLYDGRAQINAKQAELGPKLYQLEASQNHWNSFRPRLEDTLADEENADLTEAAVALNSLQVAYEATLAAAARILEPSILKYLG